ncbi:MAG: 2'-5' RNA ligase family protein [bacterium]
MMQMEFGYVLDHIGERRHNRYAVVIFLPTALQKIIAPLRQRFDPIYNLISPHLTLVFPFDATQPLEELVAAVRAETERTQEIRVDLKSIGDFYPTDPVIFWGVTENRALTDLHFRLHVRLGLAVPHKVYMPHVTVAREISHHRVHLVKDKIVDYLPDEMFVAHSVDLVTPIADDRWVSVRNFPLLTVED